jgi:putative transposase
MTDEKMALFELIEQRADVDFIREMLAFAADRLMGFEVKAATGAPLGAKSADRLAQRNGYRERSWGEAVQKTIRWIVFPPNGSAR